MAADLLKLQKLTKLIRYYILLSSTEAGSGHPSSSLSATDLLTALFFGGFFRFKAEDPDYPNNDRIIFSKGHASPLFYSLYAAAGLISEEELKTFRKFGSRLEGHPTLAFPYTEAATGSLGQGLSIGVGMAMNAKFIDMVFYRTYVLLGDSEVAEGSVWEAMQAAAHYNLDNLVAILDVNRLGQRGETMYGHHTEKYEAMAKAFGWQTIVIDGHSLPDIVRAFEQVTTSFDKPTMIIAKTIKGKGVASLEDKEGWHGKALNREEFDQAVKEWGVIDRKVRGSFAQPEKVTLSAQQSEPIPVPEYPKDKAVATRRAYGNALTRIFPAYPNLVVLDAEVSNSTYAEIFKKDHGEHFFEMYIAEQNMVGTAIGLSRRGKIPFVSTFAAFFSRAYDQIRMSQYSGANVKFVGSHAGVSIGEDGSSQMGLEDIAMFRAIHQSVVLYPSDAIATEKLVELAPQYQGIVYLRTTRKDTPILYNPTEKFIFGGSKVVRKTADDRVAIIAAGITLHEALKAHEELKQKGISVRVIDLYSLKPINMVQLLRALHGVEKVVTVEDHYPEGGLGEAVRTALAGSQLPIYSLAVQKMPMSGKPEELLDYEGISSKAIIKTVQTITK